MGTRIAPRSVDVSATTMSKPASVREGHVWLAVLCFACWFVVVVCPGLHTLYLCALSIGLMIVPVAGVCALALTIKDFIVKITHYRWRKS